MIRLAVLLGLTGCGPKVVQGPKRLAIVYSNNVQGEIEPCG